MQIFLFPFFSSPKSDWTVNAKNIQRVTTKKALSTHPKLVPIAGIGPATSPLPRECSATEPNGLCLTAAKAAIRLKANFTIAKRLERETGIEPASLAWKARVLPLNYSRLEAEPVNSKRPTSRSTIFTGGEGWIRTSVLVRGQIYSLLPLTTRPPLLGEPQIMP